MGKRKTLVLDTSVLLYDMASIHSFPGNDIVIPLVVLDELDKFKDRPGLLGESARYVNRYLDKLRSSQSLSEKITIPDVDQTIRVELALDEMVSIPKGLDPDKNDNKIIASALYTAKTYPNACVKLITKDINLRVKCDALGLQAEDYYKDHIKLDKSKYYSGQQTLELSDEEISSLYDIGHISLPEQYADKMHPNEFVVGKSLNNKSVLGIHKNNQIFLACTPTMLHDLDVEPRNKEQRFALHLLMDPEIPLVSLTGIAGSGKTFLTLVAAMNACDKKKYKRIVFTRSIQPVGRDLGYLPGDMHEKMSPWLAPIMDNFRQVYKDLTYFEMMQQTGEIEVAPLSYIRGRTFNDAFVIVDEAQNTSIHELKTIITRIGKGSKIILLGDTDQVDTPYIDSFSNGLTVTVEKFKEQHVSGHIRLEKGERSNVATIASKIL
jgi:PhoH-like ATPase